MEWDFLDAVMERMGFCNDWHRIIMGCVSSVQFDVLVNGQPSHKFRPSRGLRQGDPLSPYLFILIGEVLSRMIQEAVDHNLLEGVRFGVPGPIISHMFFVDDTLLFLRANGKNCRNIIQLLDLYCEVSGQKVNLNKSSVFFGANVPDETSLHLGNILGMKVVDNPGAYLGVPAIWGSFQKMRFSLCEGTCDGEASRLET